MSLTHFPHGIFATPNIGAGLGYGWKTDSDVYFVDGSNGSDSLTDGKDPSSAFATLQYAINAANKHDVIYVFDKDGTVYNGVTGKYTETLTINRDKHNLSIIGVSQIRGFPIRECGIYGVTGYPVLTIGAGSVILENLKFNFVTGVTFGIYAESGESTTNYGHNPVIYNCRFQGFTAGAAIKCIGLQGAQIYKSEFVENLISVYLISATATGTEYIVQNNLFTTGQVSTALISADIVVDQQGTGNIMILDNYFAHILPAGAYGRYIVVSDTRQGLISNNHFGHSATLTQGAAGTGIVCPDGIGHAANYCCAAIMAEG